MKRRTQRAFALLLTPWLILLSAALIFPPGALAVAPIPGNAANNLFETNVRDYFQNQAQWVQFDNDLRTFELRLGGNSPQVTGTLDAIQGLLKDRRTTSLSASDMVNLASQVMHHAAYPRSVDQGYHNTCLVNGLEKRMYIRTPFAVANLVRQVATSGGFASTSGFSVRLDGQNDTSLTPDWEAKSYRVDKPSWDASRSFASQLYQVTAIKLWYQMHQPSMVYEQLPQRTAKDPTGEKLYDCSAGACLLFASAPLIPISACHELSYEITGTNEANFAIVGKLPGRDLGPTVYAVDSAADLHDKLARIIQDGAMPALIQINANNKPFLEDSNGGYRTVEAWHIVVCESYDVHTGWADILGSWGRRSDHLLQDARAVSYTNLFGAIIDAAGNKPKPEKPTTDKPKAQARKTKSKTAAHPGKASKRTNARRNKAR